jgi:rare lipoprotein A
LVFLFIDQLRRGLQNQTASESTVPPVNRISPKPLPPCQNHSASWRARLLKVLLFTGLFALALASIGCGGKKQTARDVPPAPTLPERAEPTSTFKTKTRTYSMAPANDLGSIASVQGIHVDPNAKVIWSEVGYASWYGPNYNNKKGANGEIYNQNAMTAAHNTLPLNSIVRVINLKSNQSTVVRITDRGPFVGDRIIDLSAAAAKAVNVYLPGTAQVRLDVLEAPHPIETGGRWCVQIGAFATQSGAIDLKEQLQNRYPGAQVLQFKGPTGYWVRIRVVQDDKEKTREVYQNTQVDEGGVFMVRLD